MTVPDTLGIALSPAWLNEALQERFPDLRVDRVIIGPVVDRISTNVRFTVECAGGATAGVFPWLCLKGYFNPIGVTIPFVGEPEAMFYRDIAPLTGVRTLTALYAAVDPDTRHGVVITEDVIARGGEFLNATSTYTPDQVAESLGELARLHAATWLAPEFEHQAWLAPRLGRVFQAWGDDATLQVIARNLEGANGERMPELVRDAEHLIAAYRMIVDTLPVEMAASPWCVIHGDPHVGNIFLDTTRQPGLLDWQLVQRGPWYLDVGYHIASTLTVRDRRNSEGDLLAEYLQQLAGYGIDCPPIDVAMSYLSRGILHGMFLWAITTKVDPPVISELLHRLGTAAADHNALPAAAPVRKA